MNLSEEQSYKLESWLDRCELFLMDLKATKRAEIILDLSKKIQDEWKSSGQDFESFLNNYETPSQVAQKIRAQNNLNPKYTSQNNSKKNFQIWKLLLIGCLASLFLFVSCTLGVSYLIPWGFNKIMNHSNEENSSWSFNKSFHFSNNEDWDENESSDENNSESSDESKNGSFETETQSQSNESLQGSYSAVNLKQIVIVGQNLKLALNSKKTNEIKYDCKVQALSFARPLIRKSPGGIWTLSLDQVSSDADCQIQIPSTIAVQIKANKSNIKFNQILQDLSIEAQSGEFELNFSKAAHFTFDTQVTKGKISGLEEFAQIQNKTKSNLKKNVQLKLENGNIFIKSID